MTPTDRDLPKTLDGAVSAILDDCLPEPGLCEMHGRACEVLAEHRAYLEAGLIRGLSAWADRWTRGEVAEERAAVLGRLTEDMTIEAAAVGVRAKLDEMGIAARLTEHDQIAYRALAAVAALLGEP